MGTVVSHVVPPRIPNLFRAGHLSRVGIEFIHDCFIKQGNASKPLGQEAGCKWFVERPRLLPNIQHDLPDEETQQRLEFWVSSVYSQRTIHCYQIRFLLEPILEPHLGINLQQCESRQSSINQSLRSSVHGPWAPGAWPLEQGQRTMQHEPQYVDHGHGSWSCTMLLTIVYETQSADNVLDHAPCFVVHGACPRPLGPRMPEYRP